jgi:hypothetical protein
MGALPGGWGGELGSSAGGSTIRKLAKHAGGSMTDEQGRNASDLMFTGNPFVGSTDEDPLDVGAETPTAAPRQVESLPEQVYGQLPGPSKSVWDAIHDQLEREGLIH